MIDTMVLEFIRQIQNPFFDFIMPIFTILGDKGFIWIILGVSLLFFRKSRIYGVAVLLSLLLTVILGEVIIKPLVHRARPFITHGFEILINGPTSYSFPSGHTASSFAVFGIFLFAIKKYRLTCFVLAFLIAFSRIYLGVHYFSDVVAGVVLGLLDAYIIYRFDLKNKIDERRHFYGE